MSRQMADSGLDSVGARVTPRTPLSHIVAALRRQHPTATANELLASAMEIQRRSREAAAAARRAAAQMAKPRYTLDVQPAPAEVPPDPAPTEKPKRAPRKRTTRAPDEGGESSRW